MGIASRLEYLNPASLTFDSTNTYRMACCRTDPGLGPTAFRLRWNSTGYKFTGGLVRLFSRPTLGEFGWKI